MNQESDGRRVYPKYSPDQKSDQDHLFEITRANTLSESRPAWADSEQWRRRACVVDSDRSSILKEAFTTIRLISYFCMHSTTYYSGPFAVLLTEIPPDAGRRAAGGGTSDEASAQNLPKPCPRKCSRRKVGLGSSTSIGSILASGVKFASVVT